MTDEMDTAVAEWAHLLNEQQYFEAHEVLEGPWLRAAEPQRTFLKGLIHVAVALHHYRRGNLHGARVKCQSALRYLECYRPCYGGVDVAGLIAQLNEQFAPLDALPPGSQLPTLSRIVRVVRIADDAME